MHVEVLRKKSDLSDKDVIMLAGMYLDSLDNVRSNSVISCDNVDTFEINKHIEEIAVSGDVKIPINASTTKYDVYMFNKQGPEVETIVNGEDNEEILASNHWLLPSPEFRGLYESLIYEKGIKENLLNFVETIMLFSQKGIDTNLISCNRLVLLHGPPGTGKTSLCKALAQKLAIKLSYKYTHLIEINSHSLFSKWFSESGKLVMKLFEKIKEIVEHKQSLVCVLVDEVESIAFSRQSIGSNEPSDSLRVVNAVLTQLDQIRHYPNVLILTTSNLTSAIDLAFVDRADIKQYIGNPSLEAIYEIYISAIMELIRTKIILANNFKPIPYAELEKLGTTFDSSFNLLMVAQKSCNLSGRTLRKIPFLAHALYINQTPCPLKDFLVAMDQAVDKHLRDIEELSVKTD